VQQTSRIGHKRHPSSVSRLLSRYLDSSLRGLSAPCSAAAACSPLSQHRESRDTCSRVTNKQTEAEQTAITSTAGTGPATKHDGRPLGHLADQPTRIRVGHRFRLHSSPAILPRQHRPTPLPCPSAYNSSTSSDQSSPLKQEALSASQTSSNFSDEPTRGMPLTPGVLSPDHGSKPRMLRFVLYGCGCSMLQHIMLANWA